MAENWLNRLKSADNQTRREAENELEVLGSQNPSGVLQQLLQSMTNTEDAEFASLLLTKTLFDNEENFKKLTVADVEQVLRVGSQELIKDSKVSYLRRMSDMTVKVLLKYEKYDEMMNLLISVSQQASTLNLKLNLMYFIEIMCEFAFDDALLVKNAPTLNQLFTLYLQDQDQSLRVAALKTLTIFLASIEEEPVLNQFIGVAPMLIVKATEAVQIDQPTSIVAIQSLNDLLESHPKFLKNVHQDLLNLYSHLLNAQLLPELIKAALHGLQTLAAAVPSFVKKSTTFTQHTVPSLIVMLTLVDNPDWESTLDENCLQLSDVSSATEDCLGKMIQSLSVKFLLPLFVPLILQAIQSPKFNEQHAGLIAMSTLSEGASEHFKSELPNIMAMILPLAQSNEKRVIYDLLTCIAMLCQEFTPTIQSQFGSQILTLITQAIQQQASRKIQYIAIAALVDFSRDLVDDKQVAKQILGPVAPFLIEQLWKIIESSLQGAISTQQSQIAEQALSAFSSLASCLKEQFTTYYDTMMPVMIRLMQSITGEHSTIRNLLIETIGSVLTSISQTKRNIFIQDADTLMNMFLTAQASLAPDDGQHQALFYFYTQIAEEMKFDFGKYLQYVFPLVDRALKLDVGFTVNAQESTNKNVKSVKLDLKFLGLKSLQLNTSALEQKIEGAHTLVNLAHHCGKAFLPYIQQTLVLIQEFVSYKHSSDIQQSMSKCVHYLLLDCNTQTEMVSVFEFIAPALIKELDQFINQKLIARANTLSENIADSLCLITSPLLSASLVSQLLTVSQKALAYIQKEKSAITFEDEEQFSTDCGEIDELLANIVNITTELVKYNQEQFYVQHLMPEFYKYLVSKSTQQQMVNTISFFNLVLPACSDVTFNQAYPEILRHYTQFAQGSLDLKQNVLFGLGNFAKRTQVPQEAITLARSIINAPDAKSEDNIGAYETALTTLGKIGMYQKSDLSVELMTQFLQSLPHQESDASETHLMLLRETKINENLQLVQQQLIAAIQRIKEQAVAQPELELLCDQGKELISQL